MKDIVFTDLDGSLLDTSTYSYIEALDALSLLASPQVSRILSKQLDFSNYTG